MYKKDGNTKNPKTPEQEEILIANGWVKVEKETPKKGKKNDNS